LERLCLRKVQILKILAAKVKVLVFRGDTIGASAFAPTYGGVPQCLMKSSH
jgi:hypothetical protein